MEPQIYNLGNVLTGTWLHFIDSNCGVLVLEIVLNLQIIVKITIIIIIMTMTAIFFLKEIEVY